MHSGEVGIEIAPLLDEASSDSQLADQADTLTSSAGTIARALTGAEQAALKLWIDGDPTKARKYFSLSEKYASYRDFKIDPRGSGIHAMTIPPGEVVRLTPEEGVGH